LLVQSLILRLVASDLLANPHLGLAHHREAVPEAKSVVHAYAARARRIPRCLIFIAALGSAT